MMRFLGWLLALGLFYVGTIPAVVLGALVAYLALEVDWPSRPRKARRSA